MMGQQKTEQTRTKAVSVGEQEAQASRTEEAAITDRFETGDDVDLIMKMIPQLFH